MKLFGNELVPGQRSSPPPPKSAESRILLDSSRKESVNAMGYVSSKDTVVQRGVVEDPSKQPSSQMVPESLCISLQTLGGENVLNHTAIMGNMDTIATKKTCLQGSCTGIVLDIPKPTEGTKFVDLSKFYPAAGRDEEHLTHQDFNLSGKTDVSKVATKMTRVVEPEAKGRTSMRILARSFAGMGNTLSNIKVPTDQNEHMLGFEGFPTSCSLPHGRTKRKASSSIDVGLINREEVASTHEKFPGTDVNTSRCNSDLGKLLSRASMPRRSNRICQPTLRLLEGLQTSFIPRNHSVSHEKCTKPSAGTKKCTKLSVGARGKKRSGYMRQN